MIRIWKIRALALVALFGLTVPAIAQEYPAKAVTLLVPYAAAVPPISLRDRSARRWARCCSRRSSSTTRWLQSRRWSRATSASSSATSRQTATSWRSRMRAWDPQGRRVRWL